jgi:hypothetical protein
MYVQKNTDTMGRSPYARRVRVNGRGVDGRAMGLMLVLAFCLAMPLVARQSDSGAVIWIDRGDLSTLDLNGGPGGKAHEPGTALKFIEESSDGTSPKFDAEDEHGIRWKIKLGEEAKSETAATRLLWAAGYVVEEVYYRPSIRVAGLPKLKRGEEFVSGDTVTGARFERPRSEPKSEAPRSEAPKTWSWFENPFVGTREFNGLRVMMALINNWDLKEVNNRIAEGPDGKKLYLISDLGGSFGRTGNTIKRSKGVAKEYAASRFIDEVTPTHVDFVLHNRPFFPFVLHVPMYRERTRMESVGKRVPIADARWLGERLGQLSPAQIRDAFRASGFSDDEVETYAQTVGQRIEALKKLNAPPVSSAASAGQGRPSRSIAVQNANAQSVNTQPVSFSVAREEAPVRSAQRADDDARTGGKDCLSSTCRSVPLRETLTAINLKTPYARAILGGFEQGAGIGGGLQLTSGPAIKGIELRATGLVSTHLFRRIDLEVFVPKVGSSRNHADVWFTHLRRDADFFGIGPDTPDALQTEFGVRRRSYQGSFYRDVTDRLQTGVYAQFMRTQSFAKDEPSGIPFEEAFSSARVAPLERWIPGFLSDTRILLYGAFFLYDSRDNSLGLTRGVNIFGRVASADGVGDFDSTASYGWLETELDVRGYVPLGSPRTSLLLRARGQFKNPRGEDSQIPFYDLSYLGGRMSLRGYHSYRFRGNNVANVSTELQRTVRALSDTRGIDALAFVDAGQVWGDARSLIDPEILDNRDFNAGEWRGGFGGGVQYRHSPKLAVRLDVGRSREETIFYLAFSRGF